MNAYRIKLSKIDSDETNSVVVMANDLTSAAQASVNCLEDGWTVSLIQPIHCPGLTEIDNFLSRADFMTADAGLIESVGVALQDIGLDKAADLFYDLSQQVAFEQEEEADQSSV